MLATCSVVVDTTVDHAFRFLTDRLSYLTADLRVTELDVLRRDGDDSLVRVKGYVVTPYLESSAILKVSTVPCRRIQYRSEPRTISFPGRLALSGVRGSYELQEEGARTRITRSEAYETKDGVIGRWLERRGDPWLKQHLEDITLPRLKHLLENLRAAPQA